MYQNYIWKLLLPKLVIIRFFLYCIDLDLGVVTVKIRYFGVVFSMLCVISWVCLFFELVIFSKFSTIKYLLFVFNICYFYFLFVSFLCLFIFFRYFLFTFFIFFFFWLAIICYLFLNPDFFYLLNGFCNFLLFFIWRFSFFICYQYF